MTPTVETAADAQADVLVVFGITGNLARVMTFRSLYRLQKRGLVGICIDAECGVAEHTPPNFEETACLRSKIGAWTRDSKADPAIAGRLALWARRVL